MYQNQICRPLYKVTEWRNDYVYKTQHLGDFWVPDTVKAIENSPLAKEMGGDFFGPPPNKPYNECYRTIKLIDAL